MSFSYWSKVATLALLPLAAIAQQVQQAGPTDPNVPVPASEYISVFKTYRSTADEQVSPDEAWRAANAAIANQDPHAGHMAMPNTPPQPDASKVGPSSVAAPADPHAGHGGHNH